MIPKVNHETAAEILEQIKNEAHARHEYEEMLAKCPDLLSADVYAIQEIQRDEANHLLILQAMVKRYDGGLTASSDGAVKALMDIANGLEKEDHRLAADIPPSA